MMDLSLRLSNAVFLVYPQNLGLFGSLVYFNDLFIYPLHLLLVYIEFGQGSLSPRLGWMFT